MNGIGQQAKAYVSPLPTKVMTDQTTCELCALNKNVSIETTGQSN